ncbi:hypothetical protein GGR10_000544 [Bartonella chomelii]|uniref:Uncharacterized protein n=1 Tax=Bartonella chomelii TaxID=236402 RepID=A0ABR6E2C4_9HYPH|nr:hypothetical protein [Bartonella chomelii]
MSLGKEGALSSGEEQVWKSPVGEGGVGHEWGMG